jgi:hypothetical protein
VRPSVRSRPAIVESTDQCIWSFAWKTGTRFSVMSVNSDPTDEMTIATFVRCGNGAASPIATARRMAPADTNVRNGNEARIA